ncbi:MAG: amino acid deaminase [Actinomycetota bacterium]|nr:amino acid deaminase [Actinomycetota bacterium]
MTTHELSNIPTAVSAAITKLEQTSIPATAKGFGPYAAQQKLSATSLAGDKPGLHGGCFSFPLLTLHESALEHNVRGMADYCAQAGVLFAPHGKTTMSPQLAARQLAAGAWAISVATMSQLQTYHAFGFPRLLLANELTDPASIHWLASALRSEPDLEVYCYVDSLDGVGILDHILNHDDPGRTLSVFVELGHANGRTGARSIAEALRVAEAAAATHTLDVIGVTGYEGGLGHHADPHTLEAVRRYCEQLRSLSMLLTEHGITHAEPVVSAGGSAFFDVVVDTLTAQQPQPAPRVVLRSGAYITHDHGFYQEISPTVRHEAAPLTLRPALELWAPVLSRPEPTLAILQMGRRDVSFDEGLPVPLTIRRRAGNRVDASATQVTGLNDQHGYLKVPAELDLEPGDLVSLGISHPCTTFDKWPVIAVVDEQDRVINAVHTFF